MGTAKLFITTIQSPVRKYLDSTERKTERGPVSFPEGTPLPPAHLAVCHTQLLYPTALCRRMVILPHVPL